MGPAAGSPVDRKELLDGPVVATYVEKNVVGRYLQLPGPRLFEVERFMMRWLYSLAFVLLSLVMTSMVGAAEQSAGSIRSSQVTDTPRVSSLGPPQLPSDFSTFDGGWIQMTYHPTLKAKVSVLQREASSIKLELNRLLGESTLDRVHVIIGRTPGEMETLAPEGARFPKYAAGVAFSEAGLVLLTAESRYPGERHDLLEVFRHELAHIALHDAIGRTNVPRWFNEGFAIYASKEAETARLQTLWTATLADRLIPLDRLTRSFPADARAASVAYAQAADLIRYFLRSDEAHRFESLIQRLARGQEFSQALSDAYATDLFSLEKQWREDVARRYTFWPVIFGGSLVWFAAFGLMIAAYVKRRRRATRKLEVWAKEEAMEDARQRLAQAVLGSASGALGSGTGPVRILVAASGQSSQSDGAKLGEDRAATSVSLPAGYRDGLRSVPTIEHEGRRHTLH